MADEEREGSESPAGQHAGDEHWPTQPAEAECHQAGELDVPEAEAVGESDAEDEVKRLLAKSCGFRVAGACRRSSR